MRNMKELNEIAEEMMLVSMGIGALELIEEISTKCLPKVDRVIYSDKTTVVLFKDGTKTKVTCLPTDTYSKEAGLALCIAKRAMGKKGFYEDFNRLISEATIMEPKSKKTKTDSEDKPTKKGKVRS